MSFLLTGGVWLTLLCPQETVRIVIFVKVALVIFQDFYSQVFFSSFPAKTRT